MFILNEFYYEYLSIVNNSSYEKKDKSHIYLEKHHKLPKSMGGSDEEDNLVYLTAQEHYRCHELLPYCTTGEARISMLYAWNYMSRLKGVKVDQEKYAKLKEEHSKTLKDKIISENTRAKMSKAKKGKPISEATRKKISEAKKGITKSQEAKKRLSDATKGIPKKKVTCPHCNKTGGASPMSRWHFNNCKFA